MPPIAVRVISMSLVLTFKSLNFLMMSAIEFKKKTIPASNAAVPRSALAAVFVLPPTYFALAVNLLRALATATMLPIVIMSVAPTPTAPAITFLESAPVNISPNTSIVLRKLFSMVVNSANKIVEAIIAGPAPFTACPIIPTAAARAPIINPNLINPLAHLVNFIFESSFTGPISILIAPAIAMSEIAKDAIIVDLPK